VLKSERSWAVGASTGVLVKGTVKVPRGPCA
jgi:hypothetical protein